ASVDIAANARTQWVARPGGVHGFELRLLLRGRRALVVAAPGAASHLRTETSPPAREAVQPQAGSATPALVGIRETSAIARARHHFGDLVTRSAPDLPRVVVTSPPKSQVPGEKAAGEPS